MLRDFFLYSTSIYSLLHQFSPLTLSSVLTLLHVSKLTLVVCHGGTMKSEEFLLSQSLPSCSNHCSSPEQARSGNPGRSVVLSTNTQPLSSFPTSSPLLLSYLPPLLSLCFTTVSHGHFYLCFATSEEKTFRKSLGPFI